MVIEYGPFDQGEDSVLVPGSYPPFQYFWPNIFSTPQVRDSVPHPVIIHLPLLEVLHSDYIQRGLNGGPYFVPMGRVVGGGSTVNAGFFLRCPAVDYDSWEDLGNRGWGWEGLLPYFKKVSDHVPFYQDDKKA